MDRNPADSSASNGDSGDGPGGDHAIVELAGMRIELTVPMTRRGTQERMALFLLATDDPATVDLLVNRLRRLRFAVRQASGDGVTRIELDYRRAVYATFAITGPAGVAPPTAPSTPPRAVASRAYAVIMAGVHVPIDVENLIHVELDAEGTWLDRIEADLLAAGWLR